jgi:hypothetical protein
MSRFIFYRVTANLICGHLCRLADLIELRKLKKLRLGIDASKLNKGDVKKKRMRPKEDEDMDQGGLKKSASSSKEVMDDEE